MCACVRVCVGRLRSCYLTLCMHASSLRARGATRVPMSAALDEYILNNDDVVSLALEHKVMDTVYSLIKSVLHALARTHMRMRVRVRACALLPNTSGLTPLAHAVQVLDAPVCWPAAALA
ncbi:hypothetical protein EON66_09480 [archaeon]|nr:MAG: hypothetical protein EON66_09480 [archaeon]